MLPALLTGLALWFVLRQAGLSRAAWLAMLMLWTMVHFTWMSRVGRIDMPLTCATTWCIVSVLQGMRAASWRRHAWYLLGYLCALGGAVTWATYSVLSRRLASVPSDAITGFCLVTAVLAAICHFAFEQTVWPDSAWQWAAIVALGLGPVGLAFYVWDIGVKHGDIQVLGAASYAAPLLSTSILIATGPQAEDDPDQLRQRAKTPGPGRDPGGRER